MSTLRRGRDAVPDGPTTTTALRPAISAATETLRAAGVPSPRVDAEELAAHLLGVSRTRLLLAPPVDAEFLTRYRELVARRAERVPLQHLTGLAVMGALDLAVGPGVFIPRPETELLLDWALRFLSGVPRDPAPIVVDLCTGSGALALAVAHARPDARVHAVELDPDALIWARRNAEARSAAGDTAIALHAADATDPSLLTDLDRRVDLIVSNPPYIPDGAVLDPEVTEHDPHRALFGGPDGLDVVRGMLPVLTRLARPGAGLAIEHDDANGTELAALLGADLAFTEIVEHPDFAGKPRFVTARRTDTP
ncbi:peptide chain release factor N(5)-glutamine methyltransferase [Nocardia takedensis]|uniref:peptide chain release factor N(5)-glutamine methyltransferase n=1 Tax=Nocardia takedensis TaxID=259390 RepID=UPI0002D350F2|nr:peptide chain release factor N(5)-glutamine methyltransferase [Nocardia takedensis]